MTTDTGAMNELVRMGLIAAIVIPSLFALGSLTNTSQADEQDNSYESMKRVHDVIQQLMDSPLDKASDTTPFFLDSDRIMIGFDTNWDSQKPVLGSTNLFKPSAECAANACLCMYNDDWSPGEETQAHSNLVDNCLRSAFTNKKTVFISEGADLGLFGSSGNQREADQHRYMIFEGKKWGDESLQRMYIEKDKQGDTYYFYISVIDEQDSNHPVTKRKNNVLGDVWT